jgi:hypothetical protein
VRNEVLIGAAAVGVSGAATVGLSAMGCRNDTGFMGGCLMAERAIASGGILGALFGSLIGSLIGSTIDLLS